ncbi:MAG: zinc-binding dehydrogenase [Gemmataceae bacterium]|nr:zinc-binding dehydrogenase [Gemmataceae bacterium]
MVKTMAAILVELGKPLAVAELEVPPLKPGQVLVEVAFSGVCHTQLSEARGRRGADPYVPHCLGHEASGWVRELGTGVRKVQTGDAVILSWLKGSGADIPGTVYAWNGRDVNAGGVTTFSRFAVVSENRLTRLSPDFPLREAALLGCPVPTGVGAVVNTAAARPGQSVAVFGVGGVGCCAVAGALVAGCHPIVAVDVNPFKLELARSMGASQTVLASDADVVKRVVDAAGGSLDLAIEVTGIPSVMQQALLAVRPRGGIAVIVGNARHGETVEINPRLFNDGKQLRGTWGGDTDPDRDFPRYCRLVQSGKLGLAPLLSRSYHLPEINQALDDLEAGTVLRPLIDMSA